MKIVVIGGTGLIGSKTVAILRQRGHEAIAASPNSGVNTITGEGLKGALAGAQVVIDLANSPSFEDRRQTARIPRKPRLRLRHPLSRQRSCDRGGRRDAPGRRLGRQGGGAPAFCAAPNSLPPATRSARRSASTPRG